MKRKNLTIAALLSAALAIPAFTAGAKEYSIPSSQEDFEAEWKVIPGEEGVEGTWTWVDDSPAYATTPDVLDGKVGATLVYGKPFSMKAGDTWYLQAKVSSDHYNNDEFFYIVYGTDINNLQPIDHASANDFKCWGKSGGGVNWTVKPTDSQNSRIVNITEDGDYYIGVRSWKNNSASKHNYLCVASLLVEQSVDYPGNVISGKAVTLQGKMGATVTWTWPSKTKNGNDINEELSANIYRATSSSKADLYKEENLVGTVTGGVAGGKGEFIDDPETSLKPVTESGKYYYYVAPINVAGENSGCTPVIECKWIGEETEFYNIVESTVKAKIIDDNSVEISFTPRISPKNDGWYDESLVYIKVTRQMNSEEEVVLTETAPMSSPYIDNTLDTPGFYTYKLYVVYKGVESSAAKAPTLFAGGTLLLPFSEDFTDSNSLNNFSVLSSSSSYKWSRNYSGYLQYTSYSSRSSSTIATPPIKVEAGKTYHLSCTAWAANTSNPTKIMMVAGDNTAAESDLAITLSESGLSTEKKTYEAFYAPTEDKIMYFGFKGYKEESSSCYIYLDDVLIEETIPAPAAVADLVAAPDAAGALSSHISFTIPSKTNAGMDLTELDSVTVTRVAGEEAVVVKEITGDDCVPGAKVEFDDPVEEAGMYAYEVVSAMGDKTSDKVATEAAWVGYDVPKAVTSFNIRADLNAKGGADVKWSALSGTTLGMHGGYVDVENLKYRIYRVPQLFDAETVIVGETSEVTFTDNELMDAQWNKYRYCISVLNGTQESIISEGNAVVGGIVDAEYTPDFTDEEFVASLEGRAFVAENGVLAFKGRGETSGTEFMAYLPTFIEKESAGRKYKLTFQLSRGDTDYEELLEVHLCTVERKTPALEGADSPETEAAVIAGSDNRELVSTIPVHATYDSPAEEVVELSTPAEGRYRLALRCASADNKLLNVHGLSMAVSNGTTTGIGEIVIPENGVYVSADGKLMVPADAKSFAVYSIDGALVAAGKGGDAIALNNGTFIIRVVKADNSAYTVKIIK